MNKTAVALVAAVWVVAGGAARLAGADARALLSRQVPDAGYSAKSYDEMIADIKRVSGFKVRIDSQLAAFMKKASWSSTGSVPEAGRRIFLSQYLDRETRVSGLRWELDANTRTLTLTPVWKTDDDRSAAELLKALRNACGELEKSQGEKAQRYSKEWQAARKPCGRLLDALISKRENYAAGWKPMMMCLLDEDLALFFRAAPDVVAAEDFTDSAGKCGVLVVVRYNPDLIPGHGDIGYYFFTQQGLLLRSGLMGVGGDCLVTSVDVENGEAGAPSALKMKVHSIGFSENFTEKFALDSDGLRLARFIRANGKVASAEELKHLPRPESRLE